jgi:hypothetical protein
MRTEGTTTIQIKITTKDILSKMGSHSETYDDIILRLINAYSDKQESNTKAEDRFLGKAAREVGENINKDKRRK